MTFCRHRQHLVQYLYFLLVVPAFFLVNSCQQAVQPPSPGHDYYPLEAGFFRIYTVMEERFPLNGLPTTQTYQLREVLTDSYTDPANGKSYRIERYRRANPQEPWQPDSVSQVRIYDDQLIKTENNLSYIKLVFPLIENLHWNGNAYNSHGEDDYQIRNMGKPLNVLNQTFAETATVVQQNDSTLVNQDKRREIYARNVGLVYKEKIQLQFCSSTPSCAGKAKIEYGVRQYVRLQSYGKI